MKKVILGLGAVALGQSGNCNTIVGKDLITQATATRISAATICCSEIRMYLLGTATSASPPTATYTGLATGL